MTSEATAAATSTASAFMAIDAAIGSLRGLRYDFGKVGKSLYVEVRAIMAPAQDGEASRREILLTIEAMLRRLGIEAEP